MADAVIMNAELNPNPVNIDSEYEIVVDIVDRVYGILTKSGNLILAKNGSAIEYKGEGG